ncbi:MAG: ABC transporter ATP-binding protein [Deltaproteobacteria bacterium]|nr:ABC transporter ATP-binding protein [Deltaproteobacteria bacterium]
MAKPSLSDNPVLEVDDLRVRFYTRDGVVRAVNGVSFYLNRRETLGVVGESGCGKSVMALSIMGLIPQPPGRIESGTINLEGRNLLALPEEEMRKVRGNEISMIFQEPMTSLNPVLTVGFQIAESLMLHQGLSKKEAFERVVEFLELVRIPEPARRAREYPHQMSGGMRQRAMIAMALSCNPKVLIADEPTTALDVTIQAQILKLMQQLKDRIETAIIMITHDLGVIAEVAERVLVMYVGLKVEEAPVCELFEQPMHPYTQGLMASIPRIDEAPGAEKDVRLDEIPGIVPSLRRDIVGCPFAPRCGFVRYRCRREAPPLVEKAPGHWVACWETERVRSDSHG